MLCRFGRAGLAYVETDPAEADATTVIQNLLFGRYGKPLRVVALNVSENWSRDVSEAMAYRLVRLRSANIRINSRDARLHRGAHGARNAANVAPLVSTPDDRSQLCAA